MNFYKEFVLFPILLFFMAIVAYASMDKTMSTQQEEKSNSLKIGIVLQPISGSRSGPELSSGPKLMYEGLVKVLAEMEIEQGLKEVVKLTPEEEKDYGAWHRVGLANGHLGKIVASQIKKGEFPFGLLANCNSLLGMLAGLQHSGPTRRPLKVGLIWIDAHGDFNTPETTLSGMLGGMPVAVAAGKCLFRLRFKAGLDPAIPTRNIVMMGVRDLDPLEAELIENSNITMISTEELIKRGRKMQGAILRLSEQVDIIYVHIDLDVLDASEIPGAGFLVPNGPTAVEIRKAFKLMMIHEKVKAFGAASFPTGKEVRIKCLESTSQCFRGALAGLRLRGRSPKYYP